LNLGVRWDRGYEIINLYKDGHKGKDDLIFPELTVVEDFSDKYLVQRKISYGIKNINKYLKSPRNWPALTSR
jgi:hypothetical protein